MSGEPVAEHLADNLRALREARGLSQSAIARVAGVPRPTWSHLESGEGNPTLGVLLKVAAALQVRLEELIAAPRARARHFRAQELPARQKGAVAIRRLLPEPLPHLEIERMVLPPGAAMAGVPHTAGTREYLTCEAGSVELRVAGALYLLAEGDVVVFAGDQKHGYRNPGARAALCFAVVALDAQAVR